MPKKPKVSNKIKRAEPAKPRTRVSDSPINRMKRRGTLNVYELTAADEILAAHQMSIGSPVTRDPDLGIVPGPARPDAADDQAARRSDIGRVYSVWLRDVQATLPLLVVQSVVIGEVSLRFVEREARLRNGTAREHLLTGLRHFAALRGNTPRGARGWKLTTTKQEKAA